MYILNRKINEIILKSEKHKGLWSEDIIIDFSRVRIRKRADIIAIDCLGYIIMHSQLIQVPPEIRERLERIFLKA